ncbi:MFS transporter [Hyphomicrobium sp.]|uniref:MFS transporter n=1 Tax=Hyphomicrobium sp. TaxID=82 RepID=UPI002E36ACCD|nr:MFS transporter [Hyphomicrobium sp.]HEX2842516.1 MFS transporter [Hyphomicrobium sp.]
MRNKLPVLMLSAGAPAHYHVHNAVDEMPFGWRHLRVWAVSAAGLLMAGYSFFMIGIVLPLMQKDPSFPLSTFQSGAIAAAGIVGTLVGALVFGSLVDRFGRKWIFRLDPAILCVFGIASALAPNAAWLIAAQFLFGLGIGGDYPIAEAYVSETMPRRIRSRMVAGVIACQAVGGVLAAAVGYWALKFNPTIFEWRWMLASIVPIAAVVFLLRLQIPESPRWLAEHGRIDEATQALVDLLGPGAMCSIPQEAPIIPPPTSSWFDLFRADMRKQTALICLPWPCMDIAVYGIGIFTPLILLQIHADTAVSDISNSFIAQRLGAIKGAGLMDAALVGGFVLGIALMIRTTRVGMQILGFICMFVGLLLVMLGTALGNTPLLIFSGFILFNTMMNAGPNLTTYTMPTEIMPVRLRASAAGLGAACGKAGAAIVTLLFPLLLGKLGLVGTLAVVATFAVLGALATYRFRVQPVDWAKAVRTGVASPS